MSNYSLQAGFLCNQTFPAHRNSTQLSTVLLVISGINVALSITATLRNALILVALHKESSLNPPSNLFLRCLAFSDLCVGLVAQPVGVGSLMAAFYHRWNFCQVAELQHSGSRFFTCNFERDQRRQTSCAIVRHQVDTSCNYKASSLVSCIVFVAL